MGANEDVDFALFEPLKHVFLLLGRAKTVEVIDRHREFSQAFAESFVVLQRQNGGGHQHCHLFAVGCGLEGSPNGDFCLAEAHIAAHQPVHGIAFLHIGLGSLGGFVLVGRVFVHKAGLELVLEVTVGRKSKSRHGLPLGIERYEVFGNVFNLTLSFAFELLPNVAAELVDARRYAFFAAVFGYFMERIDAHVQQIAISVADAHRFLLLSVDVEFLHAVKNPHTVVDVHHVVARAQVADFFEGNGRAFAFVFAQPVLVVALKNLVIGVYAELQLAVDKAFVQTRINGKKEQSRL